MSVTVKYKGSAIAELTENGAKTLKTSGKYCEADIVVENTKDAGAAITDGIVVKSRNADGSPAEIDYYGSTLYQYQFGFNGYGTRCNPFSLITKVNFKNAITSTATSVFENAVNLQSILIPEDVVIRFQNNHVKNCTSLSEVEVLSESAVSGYSSFSGCSALLRFIAPKMRDVNSTSTTTNAMFKGCDALETVQFGSVGFGVTRLTNAVFNNAQNNLVITIYTNGSYADTALANARNGATNATIIIKASEATTYNGTSYAAGDTIITSTV